MWDGKTKAVTFSFDDGVKQDKRLIELFNKYGLKCTFNLNSMLLSTENVWSNGEITVRRDKISASEIRHVYYGHEVACHTLEHKKLTLLTESEIIHQVEDDRDNLSEICGYEIIGMAYPCGDVNNDARVANIIEKQTGIKYSRTITSTNTFNLPKDLYRLNPTAHFAAKNLDELANRFINSKSAEPQLFYIWGHSYEMDIGNISWEDFETFCEKISCLDDVFYGTNKQVLFEQ